MSEDIQLPADILSQIEQASTIATDKEEIRLKDGNPHLAYGPMLAHLNGFKRGHIACATEYAIKLNQLGEHYEVRSEFVADFENAERANEVCNKLNEYGNLKAKCDRYEKALKLAECELTSLYRKLGYSGSNILKEVTEALSAGEGNKEVENG